MIIVTYMERESTTETLGMIISYCRGLAIKIIAMVTVDKVLTNIYQRLCHPFHYVKVPTRPGN